jgi:hypothetical protein
MCSVLLLAQCDTDPPCRNSVSATVNADVHLQNRCAPHDNSMKLQLCTDSDKL